MLRSTIVCRMRPSILESRSRSTQLVLLVTVALGLSSWFRGTKNQCISKHASLMSYTSATSNNGYAVLSLGFKVVSESTAIGKASIIWLHGRHQVEKGE